MFITAFPDGRCAGVKLTYAVEPEPLDTAGAIRFAAHHAGIAERFLAVNGDVLTDLDIGALVAFHEDRGAEATIHLTRVDDPSRFGVVPTDDDGRVSAFVEKPAPGEAPTHNINAGTYVLEPSVLDRIPADRRVSIERETFPALVEARHALRPGRRRRTGSTPAPPRSTSRPSSTSSPDVAPGRRRRARSSGGRASGRSAPRSSTAACTRPRSSATLPSSRSGPTSSARSSARAPGCTTAREVRRSVLLPGSVVRPGAVVEGSVVGELAVVGEGAAAGRRVGRRGPRRGGRRRRARGRQGGSGGATMRTLVTGGAGFIGSTLVDRLLAEGHAVDVVDDLSSGSLVNLADARANPDHDFTFHRLDVRSTALTDLIIRRQPEVVFHLAAQADVRVSVERPAFDAEVNIIGTLNVLEGARQGPTRKVVFAASGGTLYGEPEDLPGARVAPAAAAVALRRVEEGGGRLPRHLPRAARHRVHRARAVQRLRPPSGPPRRGGCRRHLRRSPPRGASPARCSATASRRATSSTSTTWSTPSPGPPPRARGCWRTSAPGEETSVNQLYDSMAVGRRRHVTPALRPGARGRAGPLVARPGSGRASTWAGRPWTELPEGSRQVLDWFRARG